MLTKANREKITAIDLDVSGFPALDKKQIGHIRHFRNLAELPDGDWSRMGAVDPGQERLSSYRYQLAQMAYALGLAHYHRLPAAPGVFRETFDRLIRKMLRRDVWGYWKDTSVAGPNVNPAMRELRQGWIDPVVKENIMFSGHLHAMVGMYSALFDDDSYDRPGALTFVFDPVFWGMGTERFEYSRSRLNDVLYWQMVENGWLGIACEPNCVFIVCNQFPILGFRFHDLRTGSKVADEATRAYKAAWDEKGMLTDDGYFIGWWRVEQDELVPPATVGWTAWGGSVMNAWNREFVRDIYPRQLAGWLREAPDGTVSLNAATVVPEIRTAVLQGKRPPQLDDPTYKSDAPDFGYVAALLSEMGDPALPGYLNHADRYMNPRWENGGYYYPRNDTMYDGEGRLTYVEPLTGNAMLGYARLNVRDGLWAIYNKPWTTAHFAQPRLGRHEGKIDILRAIFDGQRHRLILTIGPSEAAQSDATLVIENLPSGDNWRLYRDRALVAMSDGGVQSETHDIVSSDTGVKITTSVDRVTDFILAVER